MTQPNEKLRPESRTLKDLIRSDWFEVPPNQREYSWGDPQLNRFWEDLVSSVDDDPSGDLGHFLGPITLIGTASSHPNERIKLIDGQQRIVTTICLAAALLEFVEMVEAVPTRRSCSSKLSQLISEEVGGKEHPRVRLYREHDFFEESTRKPSQSSRSAFWESTESDLPAVRSRIKKAITFFYEKLEDRLTPDGAKVSDFDDQVHSFATQICDFWYALLMRASDEGVLYRVFETLNERGLELSQADLVRNLLLEEASKVGTGEYDKTLAKLDAAIETLDEQTGSERKALKINEVIQFSYSSRWKSVKKTELFSTIRAGIGDGQHSPSEVASRLAEDAERWISFIRGEPAWAKEASDSRDLICKYLWKDHVTPLILVVQEFFKPGAEHARALRLVESALFRLGTIVGESVGHLEEKFGRSAREFRSSDRTVNDLESILAKKSPSSVFKEAFKEVSLSSGPAYYTLWRIEEHLGKDAGSGLEPKPNSIAQHLEHVLPKSLNQEEWPTIDPDEHKLWLQRLGNLLILEGNINRHIKNKGPKYKADQGVQNYSHSKLFLPETVRRRIIENDHKWSFRDIAARQSDLAERFALQVWPLGEE